jgi:hypothetical protein
MAALLILGGLFLALSTAATVMKRRRDLHTIRQIERHPMWRWSQDTWHEH